jgi:hypothetical protein
MEHNAPVFRAEQAMEETKSFCYLLYARPKFDLFLHPEDGRGVLF